MQPTRTFLTFLILFASVWVAAQPARLTLQEVKPTPIAAPTPTPSASDVATTRTVEVRIDATGRLQMEVWINGERRGLTPLKTRIAVGDQYLTAVAESVEPFMAIVEVPDVENQALTIPSVPLTGQNYALSSERLVREIAYNPKNVHLMIIALFQATDPEDTRLLLGRADKAAPGDPVVDVLRAKFLAKNEKWAEARAAADRAVKAMPEYGYLWRARAEVLLSSGQGDVGLESINEAMIREPFGWRNLRVRARIQDALGNGSLAAEDGARAEAIYQVFHQVAAAAEQSASPTAAPK